MSVADSTLCEDDVCVVPSTADADATDRMEYRLAQTQRDRQAAFKLIYSAYERAGLGRTNPHSMRVTPFQILPTSQIFVGSIRDEVVSTVTLVGDSQAGLPMEQMFPEEVASLRRENRKLAEVTCLADRRQECRRFIDSFSQLTRLMAQFARAGNIDNLLIAVHPKHARFYLRFLKFYQASARVAVCPYVENRPAVALVLDFPKLSVERPPIYDFYFSQPIEPASLTPYSLGAEEHAFLSRIIQVTQECDREGIVGAA